jgi:excisionase family DNA binding protein
MTDPDPDRADDPWLTIAEFAAEMRVRPVTVRSWIAKGQLRATRAGQRKWLVRRSELTRMLDQGEEPSTPPPPPPPSRPEVKRPDPDDYPPEVWAQVVEAAAAVARDQLDQDYGFAAYEWEVALEQSRMAPPDPRFASRIRHIAQAAARRAATIRECMHEPDFRWTPIPGSAAMTLSYELRPGGTRPGPKDAWDRFDRVVGRLGAAMEGDNASAVAGALSDLAGAMNAVADAIESRPARAAEAKVSDDAEDRASAE